MKGLHDFVDKLRPGKRSVESKKVAMLDGVENLGHRKQVVATLEVIRRLAA